MALKLTFYIFFMISCFLGIHAQDTIPVTKTSAIITIDGVMESVWDGSEAYNITYMIDGTNYPDTFDCSGYYKALWKNDSLYVLIFATDDIVATPAAEPWLNDGFEIYLDMDNSKDDTYQVGDYQYRFNVNSDVITGMDGPTYNAPPSVNFKIETYTATHNYRILEVVFPLIGLGMTAPVAEKLLGFDVQILDNDGSGRESALAWMNNGHTAHLDPSTHGTLRLSNTIVEDLYSPETITFSTFPNPFNSTLHVASESEMKEIHIVSMDGRTVFIKKYENVYNLTLNTEDLNPGIYFIEIQTSGNHKNVLKVIKTL